MRSAASVATSRVGMYRKSSDWNGLSSKVVGPAGVTSRELWPMSWFAINGCGSDPLCRRRALGSADVI